MFIFFCSRKVFGFIIKFAENWLWSDEWYEFKMKWWQSGFFTACNRFLWFASDFLPKKVFLGKRFFSFFWFDIDRNIEIPPKGREGLKFDLLKMEVIHPSPFGKFNSIKYY